MDTQGDGKHGLPWGPCGRHSLRTDGWAHELILVAIPRTTDLHPISKCPFMPPWHKVNGEFFTLVLLIFNYFFSEHELFL